MTSIFLKALTKGSVKHGKKKQPKRENTPKMQGFIAGAGEIQAQDINDTLRQNYMPYAMSVIMSRAIPEIDGFKPSHRKLLYTMYKMNLLGSARTKARTSSVRR